MRAVIPGVLVLLDKVFVLTSLASCLAWIVEYTLNRGWRNSLGRTLLTKTALLAGLLGLSALSAFFHLNRTTSLWVAWVAVVMLGLIGPVMLWRMWVFRRLQHASRRCPNGHPVTPLARFCPRCGVRIPEPGSRAD